MIFNYSSSLLWRVFPFILYSLSLMKKGKQDLSVSLYLYTYILYVYPIQIMEDLHKKVFLVVEPLRGGGDDKTPWTTKHKGGGSFPDLSGSTTKKIFCASSQYCDIKIAILRGRYNILTFMWRSKRVSLVLLDKFWNLFFFIFW